MEKQTVTTYRNSILYHRPIALRGIHIQIIAQTDFPFLYLKVAIARLLERQIEKDMPRIINRKDAKAQR